MADESDIGVQDTHPPSSGSLSVPVVRPGLIIGRRWRLERFLDGGGMGTVWRATDLRLDEPAAIKLLNPFLASGEEARARFITEARASAQLRGPHVVAVLDFDVDEAMGVPYMAMELLRGEDLASRLRRGPLGYLQTRTTLEDVAKAMSRAHRRGIVHRDLKPANIYLESTEDGVVAKVLDFGIAKIRQGISGQSPITDANRALGTPHYMSPEQAIDARTVDHRADIWALAVIAYQCITGKLAFPGTVPVAVVRHICFDDPLPPSAVAPVPEGFDAWFAKGACRDPEQRFQTVEAMMEAFRSLEPSIAPSGANEVLLPPPPRRSRAWASDANQVDIENLDAIVFRNALVSEFVEDDRRHFVSGAKGCGKTLLLTYKRARLAERYKKDRKGEGAMVSFIPAGRPYLDLMSDLRTVGRSAQEMMGSLGSAKRLWGFALRMAVVSHEPDCSLPTATLAALPARLRAVAEGLEAEPTVVARELLALTVSQIHQLLDATEMALERAIRSVHHGVYLFIDKLDQALRGAGRDAWIAMQAGLIEAAWDLMNTNPHVKVFATIREEAFSAYESDIKTNLFGATTRIRYSKRDLEQLLERLTAFYEGVPLADFVSVDAVATGTHGTREGVFDYLYRHTLGRPRDFVILASELSRRRGDLDERSFKTLVQETASSMLVANVFDEMRVFLEVLSDRENRARFFATLPAPALTRDDLIEAWCAYHGVERAYFEEYAQGSGEVFHPFRELFDVGLLGGVIVDPASEQEVQRFKRPHDALDAIRFDLPRSSFYLLHPSLHALLRRTGFQQRYRPMQDVLIGHGLPWGPAQTLIATVRRELLRRGEDPDRTAAQAVEDILAGVGRRAAAGEPLGRIRSQIAESPTFSRAVQRLETLGWDDLHLALLEAFPGQDSAAAADPSAPTLPS